MQNHIPQRLRNFTDKRALSVTNHRVFVSIIDLNFRGANISPLYSKTNSSRNAWEIQIDREFFNECSPDKLRKIICHELSHIEVPLIDHPPRFERIARRLGAGIYCKTRVG